MPPDLYPETVSSTSFVLAGFAICFDVGQETSPQRTAGKIAVGSLSGGENFLTVVQCEGDRKPSFTFKPLTMKFVVGAIGDDSEFEFSLTQKRLGELTHVSGKDGSIRQFIRSLIGSGYWSSDGLHFSLKGELDPIPYPAGPMPKKYRREKYEIATHIPWEVLKYMFFQQVPFVLSNYKKHA